MKIKILAALLLGISTLAYNQDQAEDEKTLRHLKEVLWPEAYKNQDTALLDRILAEEFQMIDASGNTFKKSDEMQYVSTNKPSYETFEFSISRLDIFENQTAVVSGLGVIKGKDDKGQYQTTYHSSNVLIKRADLWKAISSHVSGIQKIYLEGGG